MPDAWKRLYLRSLVPSPNPGTAELSAALPVGTFNDFNIAVMSLLPTKGTSSIIIGGNSLPQNTHQDGFFTSFSTPPVLAVDFPTGTWSFGIEAQEGSANANSFFVMSLYLYRPSGSTVVKYIYDSDSTLATEWGALPRGRADTFSGASFSAQSGDLVVLEVWHHAFQSDVSSHPHAVYVDGSGADVVDGDSNINGASWLEAPQEIGFTPRLRNVRIT